MGADGGIKFKRKEVMKVKAAAPGTTPAEIRRRVSECALSGAPLAPPVMRTPLGLLVNKEALLAAMLAAPGSSEAVALAALPGGAPRLKQCLLVTLTLNAAATAWQTRQGGGAAKGGESAGFKEGPAPFACPVADVPMDGHFRFVAARGCGCVMSERGVKEAGQGSQCPVCGAQGFEAARCGVVCPDPAELRAAMAQATAKALRKKKDKKRKADGISSA